jgi:hypothetical protein
MLTQTYLRGRVFLALALFAVIVPTADVVTDPSGAATAGATVQIKNTLTQVVRIVTTNAQDRYAIRISVGAHAA